MMSGIGWGGWGSAGTVSAESVVDEDVVGELSGDSDFV